MSLHKINHSELSGQASSPGMNLGPEAANIKEHARSYHYSESVESLQKNLPLLHRWLNGLVALAGLLCGLLAWGSFTFGMGYAKSAGIAYLLWTLLLTLLVPVLVLLRHRSPVTALTVSFLAIACSLLPFPLPSTWWALPLFTYHAGKHFQKLPRTVVLGAGLLLAFGMGRGFALLMLGTSDYTRSNMVQLWMLNSALCMVFTALTWTWGTTSRLQKLRHQELIERAERLEFEREQERTLAAVDERSRIAREMHDIVAHSLSVIVMQADGARYALAAGQDPAQAADALEQISGVSRDALAQTRGVLGLLRSSSETELTPLPTLADLPALVELARASGLEVRFSGVEGSPALGLASGVQLAAYRVVQEALTNVRKHAAGAATEVSCVFNKQGLTVEVVNEAPEIAASPLPGAGKGLQGMQERVALYHGELLAAPLFTGGFQVKAFFPYSEN
ncbi:sensor histidine kinase [Rothia aerolata]|uniref:sensor histidine kinase n=1 Tax=Rothia aerolata TaxID=1812262 RepID=UPI001668DBF6|nr:histidine kinase [Rothia aerolata]